MIKRILNLNYLLHSIFFFCLGCNFVHEEKLIDNYYLIAVDANQDMNISYSLKGYGEEYKDDFIGVVPETVFAIGYNNKFIIAKQHPKGESMEANRFVTNYYIIPLIDKIDTSVEKNIIGPLTKEDFYERCKELGVPSDLEFAKVFKDLE